MFTHSEDFEQKARDIMAQYVEKYALHIESIDPTGKVVAIEEISHRKNVFNHILQETKDDTGAYTLLDVVSSFNDFRDEYELAIEAIELNNK
jgi:hypothetical protein